MWNVAIIQMSETKVNKNIAPFILPRLYRPQRERLRFRAWGGCETLQLSTAAGICTRAGSHHPGRATDLLGPAAAPRRGLLPTSEADQLHTCPVHCCSPPLLATSYLHELHLPAWANCAKVPAFPPQEVRSTQMHNSWQSADYNKVLARVCLSFCLLLSAIQYFGFNKNKPNPTYINKASYILFYS